MSETRNCANCKWVRVREPDYEPLCYADGSEYLMENVIDKNPWLNDTCDKWEKQEYGPPMAKPM